MAKNKFNVYSKNEENLQIAFMLGGNSEEKSAKGTVWFADFKIEEGKIVQTTTGI